MARHPIVALLVSATFALQLLLVGRPAACDDGMHASADAMTAMEMPAAPAAVHETPAPAPEHSPCGQPASADCQAMSACTASVAIATSAPLASVLAAPALVIASHDLGPSSPTTSPEPPPPRA